MKKRSVSSPKALVCDYFCTGQSDVGKFRELPEDLFYRYKQGTRFRRKDSVNMLEIDLPGKHIRTGKKTMRTQGKGISLDKGLGTCSTLPFASAFAQGLHILRESNTAYRKAKDSKKILLSFSQGSSASSVGKQTLLRTAPLHRVRPIQGHSDALSSENREKRQPYFRPR